MECSCIKCNKSWISRIGIPKICPRCKTKYWRFEKKRDKSKISFGNKKNLTRYIINISLLKKQKRTQLQLAEDINLSQPEISKIQNYLKDNQYISNKHNLNIPKMFLEFLRSKHEQNEQKELEWIKENKAKGNPKKGSKYKWAAEQREKNKKEFGFNILILGKLSNKFKDFLTEDILSFFKALRFKELNWQNYTIEDVFNKYLRSYQRSFNKLLMQQKINRDNKLYRELSELYTLANEFRETIYHTHQKLFNILKEI